MIHGCRSRFGLVARERLRGVALAAAVVALPGTFETSERELQLVASDLAALGAKLESLTEEYASPTVLAGARPFAERLADAEILYLLGDHGRASLLLLDLVRSPLCAAEPLCGKAVYYLGESLFHIGNDQSAREQFAHIVRRRDRAHLYDAIRRLIQIGDRGGTWQGLDEQIALLREAGPLPPDIAYVYAKSLLRRGRLEEARRVAGEVSPTHRLGAKAQYLAAVATLQAGDLEAAASRFEVLTRVAVDLEGAVIVRELAAMNRGRILLEQGRFAEAADAYQFIGRDSARFEEALFEVTWSYVRAADTAKDENERVREYKKAQNALEILLLSDEDTAVVPEARLLLGNILLRLGAFEEAVTIFDDIVRRYEPVRDELARMEQQVADRTRYFDEITARSRQGTGLLPPLAVKWATLGDKLGKALAVVTELDRTDDWTNEAQALADKLSVVVESDQAGRLFPALREAHLRELEMQSSFAAIDERLLGIESALVLDLLMPIQARELEALLAERSRLEPEYRRLPRSRADYDTRTQATRMRIAELQRQSYRLRFPLRAIQATLDAIGVWLVEHAASLNAEDRRAVRERLDLQAREVQELTLLQQQIEEEIARERSLLLVDPAVPIRDEEVRQLYAATLERERNLLLEARRAAEGERRRLIEEIERMHLVVADHLSTLARFAERLAMAATSKSREVREQVRREAQAIAGFREAAEERRREAREIVGEVAALALAEVRSKFHALVLRADVGLVDVAWQRKEQQTATIGDEVAAQRRDLQALDLEFQDVRSDE